MTSRRGFQGPFRRSTYRYKRIVHCFAKKKCPVGTEVDDRERRGGRRRCGHTVVRKRHRLPGRPGAQRAQWCEVGGAAGEGGAVGFGGRGSGSGGRWGFGLALSGGRGGGRLRLRGVPGEWQHGSGRRGKANPSAFPRRGGNWHIKTSVSLSGTTAMHHSGGQRAFGCPKPKISTKAQRSSKGPPGHTRRPNPDSQSARDQGIALNMAQLAQNGLK